ncbi:MAG: PhzF family phenazine biosynthesis protein [Pseudomonadota bacterium]
MTQENGILPYFHVDAFADRPFTGNQAAVMPLESWLDDDVLQAIGEENNFAETAFYLPDATGEADYELRWFTPSVEIALCGHATLASGHIILSQNPDKDQVTFRTRQAGILQMVREGEGYALDLPAYPPAPKERPDIVALIGGSPVETQFHEGRYNVIRYATADDVLALKPDMKALAALGNEQFICTAPGKDTDVLSRVFVPGAGVDEDSVTGSAHAVLTPYWAGQLGRDSFTAYQASDRGGYVHCRFDEDANNPRAWLGGKCVTVVEGLFRL